MTVLGLAVRAARAPAPVESRQQRGVAVVSASGDCRPRRPSPAAGARMDSAHKMPPPMDEAMSGSRRALLAAGIASISAAPWPSLAADNTKEFSNGGISFQYPAAWLKAYDRTALGKNGGIVLVGDFKEVDTISLVRTELPEELQGLEGGSLSPQEAADAILQEPMTSTSTMSLAVLGSSIEDGHGPRAVYRTEYRLDTCRGLREEATGGVLVCMGPQGNELQTVERHHITLSTVKDGLLYTFSASATEPRWPIVGAMLEATANSFVLA